MARHLAALGALVGIAAALGPDTGPVPMMGGGGYKSAEAKKRDRQAKAVERAKHSEERLSKAEAKRLRKKSKALASLRSGEAG